ncbi:hypothetical protein JCM8097_005642 [Rhodosporidiobolus ruineniae]
MSTALAGQVPIAFDVLGTCFSFSAAADALRTVFPKLGQDHAQAVVDDWFHSSQRDFTYLSMNGSYTPIATVLQSNLPRTLLMSNLVSPSSSPSPLSRDFNWSPLVDPILSTLPRLTPRPGLSEAVDLLLSSSSPAPKFTLLAATNGSLATTRQLFTNALGEERASAWGYFSCDEDKCAKPDQRVYRDVWKRLGFAEGDGRKREGWFVASHVWDLHAARKAGFKTALLTYEEHLPLSHLWGEPEIVAEDLEEAARRIIEWETEKTKREKGE